MRRRASTARFPNSAKYVPTMQTCRRSSRFSPRLITLVAFDLGQGRVTSFSAFRFLYERLIGAEVRPWLPAAFCGAAALPHLHPELRRNLLQSISEAAATASGWSNRQPAFFPHWVEKVDSSAALPN